METKINGIISTLSTDKLFTEEELIDLFLKWIEDNKFEFIGSINELK